MARLLVAALRAGGHEVDCVDALRSFAAEPDPARLAEIEAEARQEAERQERSWSLPGARKPDLWFTYHPFYKAPDFLGACLARRFAMPYVTAEASHASKRAKGPWARWHHKNEAGIRAGAIHFCFTGRDRQGLAEIVDDARLVALPPFIPAPPWPDAAARRGKRGVVDLVTVAMMRPGDKSRSYEFLARALALLPAGLAWRLTIIGDGPARQAVRRMFAQVPTERLVWRGEVPPEAVADALARADLYVWPGFGEAYGLAYLEAGAVGLPVLALDCGGITSVVCGGTTGLLVREDALDDYALALVRLISDEPLRRRLGHNAGLMVRRERNVGRAAEILNQGLARAAAEHWA